MLQSTKSGKRVSNIKEYALYKGENLLATGTIQEIALETGKSIGLLRHVRYPCYKKRIAGRKQNKGGSLEMVELED